MRRNPWTPRWSARLVYDKGTLRNRVPTSNFIPTPVSLPDQEPAESTRATTDTTRRATRLLSKMLLFQHLLFNSIVRRQSEHVAKPGLAPALHGLTSSDLLSAQRSNVHGTELPAIHRSGFLKPTRVKS